MNLSDIMKDTGKQEKLLQDAEIFRDLFKHAGWPIFLKYVEALSEKQVRQLRLGNPDTPGVIGKAQGALTAFQNIEGFEKMIEQTVTNVRASLDGPPEKGEKQ